MGNDPSPLLAQSISAALDWWREAGVDRVYEDEPQKWLADPQEDASAGGPAAPVAASPAEPVQVAERPRIGGDSADWPQDLASFRDWWLSEPSLASGNPALRVPPAGAAGAALMVVVPMPAEEDQQALYMGREGNLVRAFAAAAGIAEDELYLASALARHTALPDWADLAETGLGDVLLHHCKLAAPRRLLILGRNILPLFGHDPAQAAVNSLIIDSGATLPVLTSYAPERLLEHARLRAGLWQKWLKWTDDSAN